MLVCGERAIRTLGNGSASASVVISTISSASVEADPNVIENVQGSSLRRDVTLCGEMFGLAVIRHRYFEMGGWTPTAPAHVPHRGRVAGMRHGEWFTGPYFAVYGEGGGKGTVAQWQAAMGIDWTSERREIAEAAEQTVHLFLHVKVRENWADDPARYREMGLEFPRG